MCHSHTGHGGLAQFSLNAHRFSFSNLSTLRALFAGWIKRSKLGSRLVSANLVAPAVLAKAVACDGAREVRSCLWPDAASVEVAAGSHTTTLPHFHTAKVAQGGDVHLGQF